jgi:predicted aspartyl protease
MGTIGVPVEIGDRDRQRWIEISALVDTGASITSPPASALRELDVQVLFQQEFRFGQREVQRMNVGQTWIRVEGREVVTPVLSNDEGTQPLLGAMALEGVFMGVEPHARRLIPVEGLMT